MCHFFYALLFLMAACSSADENRNDSVPSKGSILSKTPTQEDNARTHYSTHPKSITIADTLNYVSKPVFKVSEVTVHGDTLSIVSESDLVSHPMGKFNTLQSFLTQHKGFSVTYKDEDPDSTGVVRVYTLRKNSSFVKLFKPEEGHFLEIASGKIVDKGISLTTGITVGISQPLILNSFFAKNLDLKEHRIRIIAVYYAVDGEIQYYNFKNDTLYEIVLASVFTVQ